MWAKFWISGQRMGGHAMTDKDQVNRELAGKLGKANDLR
jgi:hypothetical protein